jgi:hypothetical protein
LAFAKESKWSSVVVAEGSETSASVPAARGTTTTVARSAA